MTLRNQMAIITVLLLLIVVAAVCVTPDSTSSGAEILRMIGLDPGKFR